MKNINTTCQSCGMLVEPKEFHPYAACLMFKACQNGNTVKANLNFVVEYGKKLAIREKSLELQDY